MKRLYGTTDPIEAELLRALLRDAGIESTLDNQNGAAYAIGLPTSVSPLGIDVSDEDAPAAADVLARHFEKRQAEDLEADPEAPTPLSDEEAAGFEDLIRRGAPRRRFYLAFFYLLPGVVTALVFAYLGQWLAAGIAGGAVLGLVAFAAIVDALAKKKPAP